MAVNSASYIQNLFLSHLFCLQRVFSPTVYYGPTRHTAAVPTGCMEAEKPV